MLPAAASSMPAAASQASTAAPEETAVVVVDHGSRRSEANDMLFDFVELYRCNTSVASCFIAL